MNNRKDGQRHLDRLIPAAEEFSEVFAEKLADRELLDRLAEKDLEKMAKIYKLLTELFSTEKAASPTVEAILQSFGSEGGETDG